MIHSNHDPLTIWFFDLYFRLCMFFQFRGIEIHGEVPDKGKSILLLQNHFSWWDGYWSFYLSKRVFKRKFHVMMLEEQLRKRMFINRCGAFSVRKDSRELIESLHYAAALLDDPNKLVCLYPQGQIQSQHRSPVTFESGASWILKQSKADVQVCFCVSLVDYFSQPKPVVHFHLKYYEGAKTNQALEKAYNEFRNQCIKNQHE